MTANQSRQLLQSLGRRPHVCRRLDLSDLASRLQVAVFFGNLHGHPNRLLARPMLAYRFGRWQASPLRDIPYVSLAQAFQSLIRTRFGAMPF
jgi:hypothetical protein